MTQEKLKVKLETWVRIICLALVLINEVLNVLGCNPLPVSDDDIWQVGSVIVTFIVSSWAAWKNNSFTQAALAADEVMDELKGLNIQDD